MEIEKDSVKAELMGTVNYNSLLVSANFPQIFNAHKHCLFSSYSTLDQHE